MMMILKNRRFIALAILLTLIGIAFVSTAISAAARNTLTTTTGTLSIKNTQYWLQTGKTKKILALIPPAAMDSLNFHPADKDTLSVTGYESKGILVAHSVSWKGNVYALRDSVGNPIWEGASTIHSNPKVCIGCRLCYMNCPAGAITMQNIGGNQRSVIDQSKCTGCNTCMVGNSAGFAGCPVKAISDK